jgi:hypothetical protein
VYVSAGRGGAIDRLLGNQWAGVLVNTASAPGINGSGARSTRK